jgi:mono/diheme cytochrome c family protein
VHSGPCAFEKTSLFCLLIVGSLWLLACERKDNPPQNEPPPQQVTVTAENQPAPRAVSQAETRLFYHLSQGSDFVPVCAIRLHQRERGNTADTAVADYFEQYGLIADAVKDDNNPLGLPIGVTLSEGRSMAGFNCAACHVARVPDNASGHVIVGAPSRFDIRKFYDDLVPWLAPMLHEQKAKVLRCMVSDALHQSVHRDHEKLSPEARDSAEALALDDAEKKAANEIAQLGGDSGLSESSMRKIARASAAFNSLSRTKQDRVKHTLRNQVRLLAERQRSLDNVIRVGAIEHTTPGPGRVDAFMTALNLLQRDTALPMTSPVGYPPLWGTSTLNWRHYDGNTNASLQRNMGQSLGVGGIFVPNKHDPTKIDITTVNPQNLVKLEAVLASLSAPQWPFEAVVPTLVQRGKEIYAREQCGRCHDPDKNGALPEPEEDAQTDRTRLDNFERPVGTIPAIKFLAQRLEALAATAPPTLRDEDPKWRTTGRYTPRALAGVWATAPYLHNNSVPSLWDLFSTQRPTAFRVDYTRYDTKNVGYALAPATGFELQTDQPGNGNQGHPWGTKLAPDNDNEEKRALIEYLKQL